MWLCMYPTHIYIHIYVALHVSDTHDRRVAFACMWHLCHALPCLTCMWHRHVCDIDVKDCLCRVSCHMSMSSLMCDCLCRVSCHIHAKARDALPCSRHICIYIYIYMIGGDMRHETWHETWDMAWDMRHDMRHETWHEPWDMTWDMRHRHETWHETWDIDMRHETWDMRHETWLMNCNSIEVDR